MKIKILDYKSRPKEVDVGELKDIRKMTVDVITGDEILNVTYKDGSEKRFDSSDDRCRNFYDGNYELYNTETEPEIIELRNPEWLNRTNYSYLNEYGDTSEADMSDWW